MMYSLQENKFGNLIICKGVIARASYKCIMCGTYKDLLEIKEANNA